MRSSWHHWELAKVFSVLQSQPTGISYTSARKRIRKSKPNRLVSLFLVLSSLGLFLLPPLRSVVSSSIGLISVLTLGLQVIIYRGLCLAKTKKNTGLKKAIVKRDGRYIIIPSRSLATGDIICLQPGDEIEADIRLVVLKDLVIAREERGKWQIQKKDTTAPLPLDIPRSEHSNMVYYGSLVTEGEAMGVVVQTYRTTPALNVLGHFPLFYYVFSIWFTLGALLVWLCLPSFSLSIGCLLFILSLPCHWLGMLEFCLARTVERLEENQVIVRSPFLLWNLSRVDQILLDLEHYNNNRFDLGIVWYGLCHGEVEGERDKIEIPILHFMPGLALPICDSLALVSDTLDDRELFTKVDVTIASDESEFVMQRQSGIVLGGRELKLLEEAIKLSRSTFDRVYRILIFSLTSGLSLLFLLIVARLLDLTPITPLQILWSGIVIPTSLSLLLLVEPDSNLILPRVSKSLSLIWLRNLCLSVLLICLSTIVVFHFTSVSLAWTAFNFSLLALGCSFVRVPLGKFYQWRGVIFVFVVVQVIWIQTARSGMTPLDLGSWLIAILTSSGVFTVSSFEQQFAIERAAKK